VKKPDRLGITNFVVAIIAVAMAWGAAVYQTNFQERVTVLAAYPYIDLQMNLIEFGGLAIDVIIP